VSGGERDDGGPAFPVPTISVADREITTHESTGGMTLRDYFAAKAMQKLIGNVSMEHLATGRPYFKADWAAVAAYAMADAMLKARSS
jgi:hypothetical protein